MKSLPSQQQISHQIVIVNNSPEDYHLREIETQNVHIIEAKTNLGFAHGCNLGLNWIYQQDSQAIVWLINPDTYLPENTLEKVPEFFSKYPKISLLGTVIYTPNQDIWFAGGLFFPSLGSICSAKSFSSIDAQDYIICDWLSGCSLIINLSNFFHCPQFDSAYFLYYEDFDFCQRYRNQGHCIAITSQLSIIHYPSSVTNRNITNKLKYSTYSYLLTLERYSTLPILLLRLLRVTLHSLILLLIKPQASLGKLIGVLSYVSKFMQRFRNSFYTDKSTE